MNTVKQVRKGHALAACIAMICGDSLETIIRRTTMCESPDGVNYLPLSSAVKYLANHGWNFGCSFSPMRYFPEETKAIGVKIYFHEYPGILHVEDEEAWLGKRAVVWDNDLMMVRDPLVNTLQPLDVYKVLCWTPITRLE